MKRTFFLLLFLLFLLVPASEVHPCSCVTSSQREKFRKADYVFLGHVVEISESQVEDFVYAVKFKVEKQWKGSGMAEPIVSFDFDNPGWCGDLNLAKGRDF